MVVSRLFGAGWGLVSPLVFKTSAASQGAGWVRFPHGPAMFFWVSVRRSFSRKKVLVAHRRVSARTRNNYWDLPRGLRKAKS